MTNRPGGDPAAMIPTDRPAHGTPFPAVATVSTSGCTRLVWQAPADMPPRNIREVLRHELGLSGTVIRRLRQPGLLTIDGRPVRVVDRIGAGSLLEAWMAEPDDSTVAPEPIPIDILHEDEHLLAIDKTDLMPVHPSALHQSGTLANAVAWHFTRQGAPRRVRPVTRLDRNTSGVTLFARTAHAQHDLARQADAGLFDKRYLGIAVGHWHDAAGTIRLPIRRKSASLIERETHPDGDESITHFEVLARFTIPPPRMPSSGDEPDPLAVTLLRFRLETGRTHQIRVHCQACGHPLLGDTLYGGPAWQGLAGQALHCDQLAFLHPVSREPMCIHSRRKAPLFALLASAGITPPAFVQPQLGRALPDAAGPTR